MSAAGSMIALNEVSKWYGNVIGVNKLTFEIGPGVTGLLGPNGAGKSTLLQLLTGQLAPSQGELSVLGHRPWGNADLFRLVGLCPEQDAFYEWMNGYDFVLFAARMSGFSGSEAKDAAKAAVDLVEMAEHMNRPIKGYSKGMRQRIKIAQAMVHDPDVLFLDEPLSGTDPVARRHLVDVVKELASRGKSIVVSSHVLHEVQGMTTNVVLLNRGRLVAVGDIRQIRDLIDNHPHRIAIVSREYRRLAAELLVHEDVVGVDVEPKTKSVVIETNAPDRFYSRLPQLASRAETPIEEVYSDDDNLEAVFKYLVSN
jgi:ABC-2 type transport system ATP-binding protein